MIVVEHDMDFVRSIARKVTVLHEGRVLAEGDMNQVQNDQRVIDVYWERERCDRQRPQPVLWRQPQLWDVNLAVPAGSVTCLMGRNGMGKTTLLKCIMGLLPATSGSIMFGAMELFKLPAEERARHGIGYVPQGRKYSRS